MSTSSVIDMPPRVVCALTDFEMVADEALVTKIAAGVLCGMYRGKPYSGLNRIKEERSGKRLIDWMLHQVQNPVPVFGVDSIPVPLHSSHTPR